MSSYFVLDVDDFVEPNPGLTRVDAPPPGFEPAQWIKGRLMTPPGGVIEAETYRSRGGMSEVFLDSIPLFRSDLVQTLVQAGVSNLQAFPARITDTQSRTVHTDYVAVNIVGCIAAADLDRSVFTPGHAPAFHTAFRELVIDDAKASGQLMFRLLQAVSTIVVHASVKQALQSQPFRYLRFIPA